MWNQSHRLVDQWFCWSLLLLTLGWRHANILTKKWTLLGPFLYDVSNWLTQLFEGQHPELHERESAHCHSVKLFCRKCVFSFSSFEVTFVEWKSKKLCIYAESSFSSGCHTRHSMNQMSKLLHCECHSVPLTSAYTVFTFCGLFSDQFSNEKTRIFDYDQSKSFFYSHLILGKDYLVSSR